MARPKSGGTGARRRIIDAFWACLEDVDADAITAGMLAERAGCNRSTFYYHFDDATSVAEAAIAEDLLSGAELPPMAFDLFSVPLDDESAAHISPERLRRLNLIAGSAKLQMVSEATKRAVVGLWEQVLCEDGEELEPDARFTVLYMVSGVLGTISKMSCKGSRIEPPTRGQREYLARVGMLSFEFLCRAQRISVDEGRRRVEAYRPS